MSPGMAAAGPAVSRPTPKKRESTGIADRKLLVLLVARLPGARAVGVHQRVDQGGPHSSELRLVAAHEDAVLKPVLPPPANLLQILVHNLELFAAGHCSTLGMPP